VFSLSNRVTGEFVLEVNTDAGPVLDLVETAREGADGRGACYRVVVRQDETDVATYEKETLLVYDEEGNLLRQHSLIPSGVEL
jgi:heat shock protein HspQ